MTPMDDLLKKHILGKVKAHTATIEWQKRGLTHAHILLIMEDEDKPKTPEKIDKVVSAEILNPSTNPRLFEILQTTLMVLVASLILAALAWKVQANSVTAARISLNHSVLLL
jgi:hypothetical protein